MQFTPKTIRTFVLLAALPLCTLVLVTKTFSANTTFANTREVACKSGSGKVIAALPDTCFTPPQNPATPPGVPIPYPNTGMGSDTDTGTRKNKIGQTKGSDYSGNTGKRDDKPASPGKRDARVNKGTTTFRPYNYDVKLEGKKCVRRLETVTSNHTGGSPQSESVELAQGADGKAQVNCGDKVHDVTLLPAPPPKVTYVDPPPFEGFIVPYRSGRIPTREEVEAYRANPEAADAQIEADIDIAEAIYAQEWEQVLARTAGVRAAADARIDAYTIQNPEYDNFPVRRVVKEIREDGFYENEILVYYGSNLLDMWVQRFDAQGNAIGRPELTPAGNVLTTEKAYTAKGSENYAQTRRDVSGNIYYARVVFDLGAGYYLFNENGEAYMGETYNIETDERRGGLFEPSKFPVLSDRGEPLTELDFVQLAQTPCPIPCQAVTDVYNATASEMNLIIREMNSHAAEHTRKNAEAQAAEAGYEEYLKAEAAKHPRIGPDPGTPVSTSVIQWHRARYEGLRETLLGFEPRLAKAKRDLEVCQCPNTAPSPLLAADTPEKPYELLIPDSAGGPEPTDSGSAGGGHAIFNWWTHSEEVQATNDIAARVDDLELLWLSGEIDATYALGDKGLGFFSLKPIPPELDLESDQAESFEVGSPRSIQTVADPAAQRWAIERVLGAGWQADQGSGGPESSVLVAVIDTGVDLQHPALLGSIWTNPGEIPGNGVDDDGNGLIDDLNGWNFVTDNNDVRDTNGHGTLVAGLVASRGTDGDVPGVDPGAMIMPLKVANYAGKGNSVDIAAAVTYAVNNGARIINISLGGDRFSEAERIAVDYALDKGALVVVASGNQGSDAAAFWPAALPGVVTVAATTREDTRADYSNWGTVVDIAAPGSDVVSLRARYTDPMMFGEGEGEYEPYSNVIGDHGRMYLATGTSFAAPLVSGAASLLWANNPALDSADVQRMLLHSARDLGMPGPDILTGYGLLDVTAALDADPAFFIDARILNVQVVQRDGKPHLQLLGIADANEFRRASVRYGAGEAPQSWQEAGKLKEPVREGVLAEFTTQQLAAEARWTVQLEVQHKNGDTRLAQFDLKLR